MSGELVDSNPYSRLMALKRMGIVNNYEEIRKFSDVPVGIGGVGSVATEMLTRCGIGQLLLNNDDTVELANMNWLLVKALVQAAMTKTHADLHFVVQSNSDVSLEVGTGISATKPVTSSLSTEEVNSESVDHDEGSESGKVEPEGKYKCPVCGALHLKPSLLKQHLCAHSEDRLLICPVENCGRQYKRQDHLNRHSLTHKGNLFLCTWEGCDLTFNVNSNLQRHLRLHEKWDADLLRGSKKPDACLACPEPGCGKSFKYPSLLQTHIENVHESLSVTEAVCIEPGCGESFGNCELLKIHTKAAHSFVFCETCGVSMLKKNLVAHARKHEGGLELMRCPYLGCLQSYNKKSNLDTHIRAIHMNLKPYACSHAGCEMRFAYRAVRDKHELCSSHVKPALQGGDFETEDSQFTSKSRGGRKRLKLYNVDDLLPRKLLSGFL